MPEPDASTPWYQRTAQHNLEKGIWSEEEANDFIENMAYAQWKDDSAWRVDDEQAEGNERT